jgi:hypothetical protein
MQNVAIYDEKDIGSDNKFFDIKNTRIELINELDDWYQVYYISNDLARIGYILKGKP